MMVIIFVIVIIIGIMMMKMMMMTILSALQSSYNTHFQGHPTSIYGKICSEDDLRSRIFGTVVVQFFASLPLLGFSNI